MGLVQIRVTLGREGEAPAWPGGRGSRLLSFPGSAWEWTVREALPLPIARRSLDTVRSQAEPGNEVERVGGNRPGREMLPKCWRN